MKPPAGPVPPDAGGADGRPPALPPAPAPPVLVLFGVPLHNLTTEETLAWIAARARSGRPAQVVTSNLDFIMQAWRDPEMHRIHLDADLVIADGWPPVFFSRFFGPKLQGRVAGSDLVVRLGPFARDRGLSVYALGGREGVAAEALRILGERSPGLSVAGCSSPPMSGLLEMDHAGLSSGIARANPHLLLVAFGAPKQDKWIRINLQRLGGPVAMGIGASLDFIVGAQTRAPRWVQSLAMEWLWRLCSQPRRLFRRYSSNIVFLSTMLFRLTLLRLWPGGNRPIGPLPEAAALDAKGAMLARIPALSSPADVDAFCAPIESLARERIVVLDLSGISGPSSLVLGAIVRLARAARTPGRRLLLSGVRSRTARLLRLMRLDRWLEIPASAADWDRRLEEFAAPEELRRTRWLREGSSLEIVLADEFEGAEASRLLDEMTKPDALKEVRTIVVDGRRLRFIDSSGLLFLRTVGQRASGTGGGSLTLRSFPRQTLELMQREGLGALAAGAS